MAIEQLIKGTINESFRKYIYDEMVVGKLACTQFKDGYSKGDEVDVIMPGTVNLFDYDGGTLPDAEEVVNSIAKVRLDKAKAFNFTINEIKRKTIENTKDPVKQITLIKEYSMDAVKQFASAVDLAYANLYTRAGHYLSGASNAAITVTSSNAKTVFAYMQAKFKRGDNAGHTSWIDGQMMAVIPPELQFYLTNFEDFKEVESGQRKLEKGLIGRLAGWDIVVSNDIRTVGNNVFYPLFGIKGKTLAGGISSNLNTQSYKPEANFNTAYKGYGMFGVGAPRADFLGTAKLEIALSL